MRTSNPSFMENFGRNLSFQPAAFYMPADEKEVLQILEAHAGEPIRAIGRLHSWSQLPDAEGILLDLRRLNQIEVVGDVEAPAAIVGAGCQIKELLKELDRQAGWTLPSLGLVTEQSIAGAISSGTHGSGQHSLSHHVEAVRIACYDSNGRAVIHEIAAGEELRAARCSLGCMGILLSVRVRCRAKYNVEEHFRRYNTLAEVLSAEDAYPRQQFFVIPWSWHYQVQHQRETSARRSWSALLYRLYRLLTIDLGMHLVLLPVVWMMGRLDTVRFIFRTVISHALINGWKVTDDASSQLVMRHQLFRHIEIELFVRRGRLGAALNFLREVVEVAGGASRLLSQEHQRLLHQLEMDGELARLRGRYCHHYPICIRRILPDDTLISMASGAGEPWYSISLISYAAPAHRGGFFQFAEFIARSMAQLFGARPHWGKFCPLSPAELKSLYPRWDEFQQICDQHDRAGVFRNRWTSELFEVPAPEPADEASRVPSHRLRSRRAPLNNRQHPSQYR